MGEEKKHAYFAGGCFWCVESAFQDREGVLSAVSGFSGGTTKNPSYRDVASGNSDHREAIEITYDATKIDYKTLLNIFWRQIDPTDGGGQFADRGHQYSTAIFYTNEEERKLALESKKQLEDAKVFNRPIITEIVPFTAFYPAEEYHQDYYKKNSFRYKLYYQGSGRKDFRHNTWKSEVDEQDEIPTREELNKLKN